MSAPKILSVDDSRMIHTLINKGFAPYDVQMVFASNGVEGLEAAAREMPDVILLDVTMPVMDGVECLSKLKADPSLKDIPVIMLTAEAGKENVLKIAKMGVRDYIVKPFTESAVIDRVSRIVDLKPKSGAPASAPAPAAPAAAPAASVSKKKRTVTDAIKILVVDEHPAIIESIQKAVDKRGWKVIGCPSPEAAQSQIATTVAAEDTPDVILVSLAFPNKAAHKFFVSARSHPAMREIPVLGLAVKTATFEQTEAKDAGFEGVITKPLDLAEIPDRLARAMELDITPVFYSAEGDVQVVTIPQDLSESGSIDLSRQSRNKIAGFVNAGFSKLLIDLSGVSKVEIPVIRAVASIVHECSRLEIQWRFVGTDVDNLPNFPTIVATNLKVAALKDLPNPFKGTNIVDVHPSRAAAIASL
jgi:two-component system cell cycle response regulator